MKNVRLVALRVYMMVSLVVVGRILVVASASVLYEGRLFYKKKPFMVTVTATCSLGGIATQKTAALPSLRPACPMVAP
jgi:hypothetical protein